MHSLRILPFIGLFLCHLSSFSQETERTLSFNGNQASRAVKDRGTALRSGGGSLALPFFDDFSRYSLPTSDPSIPADWQRWNDAQVFLNSSFPVAPPTIGVVTFDGLNEFGYPYDFTDEFAYGPADTLTSLPIDLSGFSAGDNIYLTFHYEAGGIGNAPDPQDSLVLEFYSPFGAGEWFHAWSVPGTIDVQFQQVFIPIDAPEFLLDGFRFRFRNYATISGAFDQWHLDYVLIRDQMDPDLFEFDEVAFQYPNHTLLSQYSAMPWTHFVTNPDAFMATNFGAAETNLDATENIVTGYSVAYEGAVQDFPNQDFNTSNNGFQSFTRTISLNGFNYDPGVNDTCAVFDVCTYINPTDPNLQNDTTCFQQVFTNYYAYDDGSAERAYAVEASGASVAVKYRAEIGDTLLGVMIHWIPYGVDVSDQNFLLRIWGDGGNEPGSELIENFTFHAPAYFTDVEAGYNLFSYYPFDEPVYVDGNFYVGWTQPNAIGLNVGNDKNTNSNGTKLFYKLGLGEPWLASSITGSVMIRPVFRAGKLDEWTGIPEAPPLSFSVYPNPAEEFVTLELPGIDTRIALFDLSGRIVLEEWMPDARTVQLSVAELTPGMYVLSVTDARSGSVSRQTLVIR